MSQLYWWGEEGRICLYPTVSMGESCLRLFEEDGAVRQRKPVLRQNADAQTAFPCFRCAEFPARMEGLGLVDPGGLPENGCLAIGFCK